ncbi:MAG: metallophosphoesterase family protein [Planctomycetales bacterium]|nr:metallophosphoesterase family protein [Planctomycetales bacterium]
MILPDVVYNGVMAVVTGACLWGLNRHRHLRGFLAALSVLLLSGLFFAVLSGGIFFTARLLSYVVFVHLPVFGLVAATVLRCDHRRIAGVTLIAALTLVATGIDAFFIEPHWLDVTTIVLESSKVDKPLTLLVMADLQTDRVGLYEERVFREAMSCGADAILMAGDYLQMYSESAFEHEKDKLRQILDDVNFHAPLGVYAVQGNTDYPRWREIFADHPVHAMSETTVVPTDRFTITGLSMADSFTTSLSVPRQVGLHIVLGHSPDFSLGDCAADLIIAGHVHGGQVRLPGLGPLVTLSAVPRRWAVGANEIRPGTTLAVSRGIGMERGYAPRLRFLCRPELMIIRVVPSSA